MIEFDPRRVLRTAAAIASALILVSCVSVRQSSFQGLFSGARAESTYIDLGSSDPLLRLSGAIDIEAGACALTLKDPGGTVVLERTWEKMDDASLRISIDETIPAGAGVWLLEIGGVDDSSAGSYDLTLSNR